MKFKVKIGSYFLLKYANNPHGWELYKGYKSVTEMSAYPSLLEWHREDIISNDIFITTCDSLESINSIMQYTAFQN